MIWGGYLLLKFTTSPPSSTPTDPIHAHVAMAEEDSILLCSCKRPYEESDELDMIECSCGTTCNLVNELIAAISRAPEAATDACHTVVCPTVVCPEPPEAATGACQTLDL